jgi:hypothetical protein
MSLNRARHHPTAMPGRRGSSAVTACTTSHDNCPIKGEEPVNLHLTWKGAGIRAEYLSCN